MLYSIYKQKYIIDTLYAQPSILYHTSAMEGSQAGNHFPQLQEPPGGWIGQTSPASVFLGILLLSKTWEDATCELLFFFLELQWHFLSFLDSSDRWRWAREDREFRCEDFLGVVSGWNLRLLHFNMPWYDVPDLWNACGQPQIVR